MGTQHERKERLKLMHLPLNLFYLFFSTNNTIITIADQTFPQDIHYFLTHEPSMDIYLSVNAKHMQFDQLFLPFLLINILKVSTSSTIFRAEWVKDESR